MAAQHSINVDLAQVYKTPDKKGFIRTLSWGSAVEVRNITPNHVEVVVKTYVKQPDGSFRSQRVSGFIKPSPGSGVKPADIVIEKQDNRVLQIDFVDVQQGDGAVIETPGGKIVLIDGGDNQLFARYLAQRFAWTRADRPKEIDCIVVTHGDADHFLGLAEIHASETDRKIPDWKRLFIHPQRVYHNGLVKRPDTIAGRKRKDVEMLGQTQTVNGKTIITGLVDDLLGVDEAEMNLPFRNWKKALQTFQQRGPIEIRRLEKGEDAAFDFLADENLRVEVLGPIVTKAGAVRGLEFLGTPKKGVRTGRESDQDFTGLSASHTINGHSIIFRLTYGGFRCLFTGDLNEQAARALLRAHARAESRGDSVLEAEVFKVPHHGSADFSTAFIAAVSPIVSIVSSGDESARKEFIHPRATLMGALGKYSRLAEPLIFVTELVAFFEMQGFVRPEFHKLLNDICVIQDGVAVLNEKAKRQFFAFSRAAFGIVKIRTDGKRLLVYTNSGQADLKEAYAFEMDAAGNPTPKPVRQV
ncbi:MAG TPA: MBL fold metallo-hydrolase [Anaerolineae bacterium]|nr:MBL fold metallo-hydrolase [Anaerolineae bacterium]